MSKRDRVSKQKPVERVRVTLVLDVDVHRRLGAYARFCGRDMSAVVSDALGPVLSGLVVYLRTQDGVTVTEQRSGGEVPPPALRVAGSGS